MPYSPYKAQNTVYKPQNCTSVTKDKLHQTHIQKQITSNYWANLTILANESAVRAAPPTKHPSISGMLMISFTLSGLTDPPYWMIDLLEISLPYLRVTSERMYACTSWATSTGQTRPVPMAHTGSSTNMNINMNYIYIYI